MQVRERGCHCFTSPIYFLHYPKAARLKSNTPSQCFLLYLEVHSTRRCIILTNELSLLLQILSVKCHSFHPPADGNSSLLVIVSISTLRFCPPPPPPTSVPLFQKCVFLHYQRLCSHMTPCLCLWNHHL